MKRYLAIKAFICIALLLNAFYAAAQRHEIYNDRIASLQVVADEAWLSPPVIRLHSHQRINIDFDDLTHEYHRYMYKIEHCEWDWTVSEQLFASDYIDGFSTGTVIDNVEESVNTNVLYSHYSLQIPNSLCRIKLSGNYKVTVYDDNNDEEPIFTACFMVVEPKVGTGLNVTTNTDIGINTCYQQVGMEISYPASMVTRPLEQIKTIVMQNGRWDNARINPKAQYVQAEGMQWDHNRDLIFESGNEYRKFEVLDTDHPTMGIDKIRWDGDQFHAFLFPDIPRPNYLYDEDANGAFYIRNSDNIENNTFSDYVMVHFTIPGVDKVEDDVYINGYWTYDRFDDRHKMEYDYATRTYSATVPLKQGYYSYQYLVLHPNGQTSFLPSEGNFFETENTYQALVYYKENGGRYDQLVGYQELRLK